MKKTIFILVTVAFVSCGSEDKIPNEKPLEAKSMDTIRAVSDTVAPVANDIYWPAGWYTEWIQAEEVNGKFYSLCNGTKYEIDTMSNQLTEMDAFSAARHEVYRTEEFKDRLRLYCASVHSDHPEDTLIIDFLRASENTALVNVRYYYSYAKNKNEFTDRLCYAIVNGEMKPYRKPCSVGLQ